ncbi:MAG: metallophosphoesterase [Thermoplasmata archaeon]|nr:metallophosphoesterase [Thermoplasmata archaeon]
MNLLPIIDEPALFAKDINALIVADLHIGIEHEIFLAGAKIPGKTGEHQAKLIKLLKETGAKKLIIAGDLKHNIPVSSFREVKEIPDLIFTLFEYVDEIHLSPGNHDGGIKNFIPGDVKVHSSKGFTMGEYGIWHGHCWPSEEIMASKRVLMAHIHPQAAFVDGVRARSMERCWVRGKWNRKKAMEKYPKLGNNFVMIPAFNDLCGGSHVNDNGRRRIGTVLRNELADIQNAEMFLLDGTNLGKIKDNLVVGEKRFFRKKKP